MDNILDMIDVIVRGIRKWIAEMAWRDFYKHILVDRPYIWYNTNLNTFRRYSCTVAHHIAV
jgi:deoxyribodipyrimidine photolyase